MSSNENKREYRINGRVESVEGAQGRKLYRVLLEPDDESGSIIATIEALENTGCFKVRPVMPVSFVHDCTLTPVSMDREDIELAVWKVIDFLVDSEEDLKDAYLDDKPGW